MRRNKLESDALSGDPRKRLAYHEAGHVAMHFIHGLAVERAELVRDDGGSIAGGWVDAPGRLDLRTTPPVSERRAYRSWRRRAWREVEILIAGSAAESLVSDHRPYIQGGRRSCDWDRARLLIGRLLAAETGVARPARRLVRYVTDGAFFDVVGKLRQPEHAWGLEFVAQALAQNLRIDGRDARRLWDNGRQACRDHQAREATKRAKKSG